MFILLFCLWTILSFIRKAHGVKVSKTFFSYSEHLDQCVVHSWFSNGDYYTVFFAVSNVYDK